MTALTERRRQRDAERRRLHKARQALGLAVIPVVDDQDDAAAFLEAMGALPRGRDHTVAEIGAALTAWFQATRQKFSTDASPRADGERGKRAAAE